MILNTGNRTDIPAFFSDWFFNRIQEGFVCVRNPYFPHQVTKYILDPQVIDIICFCTKNPKPMLSRLDLIKDYKQFWFVTITPYNQTIEPYVPNKNEIIRSFIELSKKIGSHCIGWRYDPIFLNDYYTIEYHLRIFEKMCQKLTGYTHQCVISFIDLYQKTKKNFKEVEGIEFQMKLLTELSGDYSETILDNLANKEMVIKNAKEDLDAYYSGNTQYYEDEQNLLLNQLEQLNDSDKEKYEKYWNILAYNRNIHMKDTLADSIHNNKHDFIGVGCKHLYGKKGIIQLLKDDGYLVECMK